MKPRSDPLLRHLTIAVVVKLAVLTGLWWSFVRTERVPVDAERTATRWLTPSPASNPPADAQGAQR